MSFIDCNEQVSATKAARPERPHCEHGMWISNGDTAWVSPTYSVWKNVKKRANYSDNCAPTQRGDDARFYAGVSTEWETFSEFVEAMGRRPSVDHSIDRIDDEGDYTAENCRWLLTSTNKSLGGRKGGRTTARKRSAAMIERMQDELQDLETELLKEGIEINE